MYKNIMLTTACALIVSTTMIIFIDDALGQNTATGVLTGPDAQQNDFVLKDKDLVMRDENNKVVFRLEGQTGDFRVFNKQRKVIASMEARGANLSLGGHGRGGDLVLFPRTANNQNLIGASVHIDGSNGKQKLGGGGTNGELGLINSEGKASVLIAAKTGELTLMGTSSTANTSGSGSNTFSTNPASNLRPTIVLDGELGKIKAGQIVLDKSAQGASKGIDTAAVYLKSENPAISLHDNGAGNKKGWMIQSTRAGKLVFNPGNLNGLSEKSVVFERTGGLCVGFCKQGTNEPDSSGRSLKFEENSISAARWSPGNSEIPAGEFNTSLQLNRDGGAVHIGSPTSEAGNAKLLVGGTTVTTKLITKELIVKPTGWADYVFDSDYSMMPSQKLETYLQVNRHLPGIQSEASVLSDGLSVNQFNVGLLRNVEELTLRVLQQAREIDSLRASQTQEIQAVTLAYSQQLAEIERTLATMRKRGEAQ